MQNPHRELEEKRTMPLRNVNTQINFQRKDKKYD